MDKQKKTPSPITVFYSYTYQDEELREQLEHHLNLLRQQNLLVEWHNRKILPGSERDETVSMYLNTSSLILLLVSSDYLASDYCYSVEMKRAMIRHDTGDAWVIPVILRPVNWEKALFAKLEPLPRGGKPITLWTNQDEAFLDVTNGVLNVIEYLRTPVEKQRQHPLSLREILTRRPVPQEGVVTQTRPTSPDLSLSGQAGVGKYTVQNFGAIQGFIQGDNAHITLTFTNPPESKQEPLQEQKPDD